MASNEVNEVNKVLIDCDDGSQLTIRPFNNNDLLKECVDEIDNLLEVKPEIQMFGKICHQQRNIGFFSDVSIGYKYSGQLMKSQQLTENLMEMLDYINELYESDFNSILVNKYIDGNDYIGSHSDDETKLAKAGVVCVSYGASRIFRIRDKETKKIVLDVETDDKTIMHMSGNFQKLFKHEIPIQKKVKEPRWSFTFRRHLE